MSEKVVLQSGRNGLILFGLLNNRKMVIFLATQDMVDFFSRALEVIFSGGEGQVRDAYNVTLSSRTEGYNDGLCPRAEGQNDSLCP